MWREEQARKDWGMSNGEDSGELGSEISIVNRGGTEHDFTCSCSWVKLGKESESKENLRVSCL